MRIHLLITLLGLHSGVAATQLSLFEGPLRGPGNVVVLGQPDEHPPELQGITLMPIEVMGRTRATELQPEQTRLRTDVPGASRLLLPREQGSLYKFRRKVADASTRFGLFVVNSEGRARLVLELPGSGASGSNDPIPGRVAVAADGRALLVATTEAAGGDVWEVDLVSATAENRTLALAPETFERNGLILLQGWGLALARDGVFRFERAAGAQASALALPAPQRWFGPDVVRSADGSTVAFLAGEADDEALVFACRRQGAAQQVSHQPMHLHGAGFLPEDETGPALALSTDGSWAAWRAEGASRECFARALGPAASPTDLHVTDSTTFHYTLNDTGVISFIDPNSLVLVVGRSEDEAIEYGDLFRLDLTPSGFDAQNLSRTSGILQPPFDYGWIDTRAGIYQVPGTAGAHLVHEEEQRESLLWVNPVGPPLEVLDRVASLDSLEVAGNHLVASVTRPPGVDDPVQESLSLVQIPPGGQGTLVVRMPGGCHLSRGVGASSHGRYAAVLEFPTGERLGRLDVPSTVGLAISPSLVTYGPTTGLSVDGDIFATVQVGIERAAFAWSDLGTQLLRTNRVESFLLPGL